MTTRNETVLAAALLLAIIVFGGLYASLLSSISAINVAGVSTKLDELSVSISDDLAEIMEILGEVKPPTPPEKLAVYHTTGDWPPLTVFNGNPFSPDSWWVQDLGVISPLMYRIPGNDTWVPGLADSFELDASETPAKLTIHLGDNYWHDGGKFTSKDVLMTHAMYYALWHWDQLTHITGWELPDDYTITFFVKDPSVMVIRDIIFCEMLCPYHIFEQFEDEVMDIVNLRWQVLQMKEDGEEVPNELTMEIEEKVTSLNEKVVAIPFPKPLGNGPFYVSDVTDNEITLKKFELGQRAPRIRVGTVVIHKVPSADVNLALFMDGRLDQGPSMTPDVWETVRVQQWSARRYFASSFTAEAILFNFRREPMKDLAFRKAVAFIIDRSKVIEAGAYIGIDPSPYNHGILPSVEDVWLTQDTLDLLTKYEPDREKAEEILEGAGYKKIDGWWRFSNGTLIELEVIDTDPIRPEEVSRQLSNFGIKASARVVPTEFYEDMITGGEFDICREIGVRWFVWYSDPSHGYRKLYYKNAPHMDEFLRVITDNPSDQPFDTPWGPLVPEDVAHIIVNEFDETIRKEAVQKAAYITNEYLPVIELYEPLGQRIVLDGERVTGWPSADDPIWTLWWPVLYWEYYLGPVEE